MMSISTPDHASYTPRRRALHLTALVSLALGILAGCSGLTFVRGGTSRGTDRVEGSMRDGRSSSDQLYDSYGRLTRERSGN